MSRTQRQNKPAKGFESLANSAPNSGRYAAAPKPAPREQRPVMPRAYPHHEWREDGVDHINIDHHGKTDLGRALWPFTHLPFNHEFLGQFSCIRGFMAWLQYRDCPTADTLRKVSGTALRNKVGQVNGKGSVRPKRIRHFRALVASALLAQITQHREVYNAMVANDLPMDTYAVTADTDLRYRSQYDHLTWYSSMLEDICEAMQADKEIDLTRWADGHDVDNIYIDAIPGYQMAAIEEKRRRQAEQEQFEREEQEKYEAGLLLEKQRLDAIINHPKNVTKDPHWVPPSPLPGDDDYVEPAEKVHPALAASMRGHISSLAQVDPYPFAECVEVPTGADGWSTLATNQKVQNSSASGFPQEPRIANHAPTSYLLGVDDSSSGSNRSESSGGDSGGDSGGSGSSD